MSETVSDSVFATMPIRMDIEVLPADEPKQLKLGWVVLESFVGTIYAGGLVGWSCSLCGGSGFYNSGRLSQLKADLHVLTHEKYNGGSAGDNFHRLIDQELRSMAK